MARPDLQPPPYRQALINKSTGLVTNVWAQWFRDSQAKENDNASRIKALEDAP